MRMPKKKQKQYEIRVNDTQLKVINAALESYFRTRMNQWFDFADEVAKCGYVYDRKNPDNDKLFYEFIKRRNESEKAFGAAFRIAQPIFQFKSDNVQTAIDMWEVIEHMFWVQRAACDEAFRTSYNTHACQPFQIGSEPLITVTEVVPDGQ